jgi:carbohydrate kinase (thermoresistant glucokinase family)
MGVTGSGKSTLGAHLAELLGWEFAEGDAMHPSANVTQMAAGTPLTDADRWPWLEAVSAWIREHDSGAPGIITCSALKRSYRQRLRGPGVEFVHLVANRELITERLTRRTGHFMPAALLNSQLATLEDTSAEPDVVSIDADLTTEQQAVEVVRVLRSWSPGA